MMLHTKCKTLVLILLSFDISTLIKLVLAQSSKIKIIVQDVCKKWTSVTLQHCDTSPSNIEDNFKVNNMLKLITDVKIQKFTKIKEHL